MLPLVRIPCILVATVGLHVSVTPPTPPPTEGERAASTSLEALLGHTFPPSLFKVRKHIFTGNPSESEC